eukprot:357661-Chlamydomonas_euryale.AAC.4
MRRASGICRMGPTGGGWKVLMACIGGKGKIMPHDVHPEGKSRPHGMPCGLGVPTAGRPDVRALGTALGGSVTVPRSGGFCHSAPLWGVLSQCPALGGSVTVPRSGGLCHSASLWGVCHSASLWG